MPSFTHQTIKLSRGRHSGPHEGACVMELASMLAGERFTDHPQSVCPVIGSFLRAYNDSIDDDRRQDLYAYASKVVGSRGSVGLQEARARYLTQRLRELKWSRRTRALIPVRWRMLIPHPQTESVGALVVGAIRSHSDRTHREVLNLIDELLALGAPEPSRASTLDQEGTGELAASAAPALQH